jgi:Flp pilus assembly protein TadG
MRKLLLRWRRRIGQGETGQALILFAAGLVAFLGLVGLSVDVGLLVYTRTDLQKSADAAAMAGAQDLPSATAATASANNYVTSNSKGSTSATVTVGQTYATNDTITVTTKRHVDYFFMKVLGLTGSDVTATAKARANSYSGGTGVVPWGFIASNNDNSKLLQNACYLGQVNGVPQFKQNTQCTMKYGAGTNSGGDFGALAIDGTGSSLYRSGIGQGSNTPIKKGDLLEAQTGDMQGPTKQGIDDRFSLPAPSGCPGNDRNQVLITNPDGSVSIRPGCESSPRIIVIPVVDKIENPAKSTVLGFSYMYLTGSSNQGGHSQVTGEFVKFVTELANGVYQGAPGAGSDAMAMMLVQ